MVKSWYGPAPAGEKGGYPILVAGLPGVPGYNAFHHYRTLHPGRVIGLCPPHIPKMVQVAQGDASLAVADAENPEQVDAVFRNHGFRTVIDATGWCALKSCEQDPALARRLNVDAGLNLMRAARGHGARLIRLSTDLVFGGRDHGADGRGYHELDPVSPVTVYGKMMAEAEEAILQGYPEAVVLRISLPMGPSFNGHAGAIDWIESRFRKGRPATLYFDEVRSSLYVQDLNRALAHFFGNGTRGIYHLGGPLPLSLYQIAQAINRLGGYSPDLLMGCPRAAAGPMPPRAGDVRMDSSKAVALLPSGCLRPWPLSEDHRPGGRAWHSERNGKVESGSVGKHLYGTGWPDEWDHPLSLIQEPFLIKFTQMEAPAT